MTEENGEILIEEGPVSKRLRIALRVFKGIPLLDLRYWYLDKKDKKLKPTGKGIALTRTNYLGMRSVAVDHHDAVMEFLDVGSVAPTNSGDSELIARQNGQKQQSVQTMSVEIAPLKPSSKLYEVEYKGAVAIVFLNINHPFVDALSTNSELNQAQLEAVGKLILAMDFCLMNVTAEGLASSSIIADQFEYDLNKYSQRLSKVGK